MGNLLNFVSLLAIGAENAKSAAVASLSFLGASIAMGAALCIAIVQTGKHPEAAVKIKKLLMLGLALIEGVAIFGFIISLLVLFG